MSRFAYKIVRLDGGSVLGFDFTSMPGLLWLLPPLATWTSLKSRPIASGLNAAKNV